MGNTINIAKILSTGTPVVSFLFNQKKDFEVYKEGKLINFDEAFIAVIADVTMIGTIPELEATKIHFYVDFNKSEKSKESMFFIENGYVDELEDNFWIRILPVSKREREKVRISINPPIGKNEITLFVNIK